MRNIFDFEEISCCAAVRNGCCHFSTFTSKISLSICQLGSRWRKTPFTIGPSVGLSSFGAAVHYSKIKHVLRATNSRTATARQNLEYANGTSQREDQQAA